MKSKLFGQFIYRSPAFDWARIKNSLNPTGIVKLSQEPDIAVALYESSPEFYQRFQKKAHDGALEDRDYDKMAHYLVRMATRATPYGYFSGVGLGRPARATGISSQLKKCKVTQVARHPLAEPLSDLWVLNPTVFNQKKFARFYQGTRTDTGNLVLSRFDLPKDAKALIKKLDGPFNTDKAIQVLTRGRPALRREAMEFFKSLVKEEVFLRAVRPLLEGQLEDVSAGGLEDLQKRFRTSSERKPGAPLPWISCTVFDEEISLEEKLLQKSIAAAELVSDLFAVHGGKTSSSPMLSALKQVLEKNFDTAVVPLLSITEPVLKGSYPKHSHSSAECFEDFFQKKIRTLGGINEWRLSSFDIEAMKSLVHRAERGRSSKGSATAPASIFLSYSSDGNESYVALQMRTACSASRLVSRFGPWSRKISRVVDKLHAIEASQQLCAGTLSADVEHRPRRKAFANFLIRRSGFSHYIDVCGTQSADRTRISLAELGVKLEEDRRVTLWSLKTGQEISAFMTHPYNEGMDDHFYFKLLTAISSQNLESSLWSWGRLEKSSASLPRVVYGDIILKRARWRLIVPPLKEKPSFDSLKKWIFSEIETYGIPDQVYWVNEGNERLWINLRSDLGQRTLQSVLSRAGEIALEEILPGELESGLELVLFTTTDLGREARGSKGESAAKASHNPDQRIPGGKILFYKVYADPDDFNFVIGLINKKLGQLSAEMKWSFVRYGDPEPHLRIRVFALSLSEKNKIESALFPVLERLKADFLLQRVEYGAYVREVERYGGGRGVLLFESLSRIDSQCIANLISKSLRSESPNCEGSSISVGADLCLFWLNYFFNSRTVKMQFCKDRIRSFGPVRISRDSLLYSADSARVPFSDFQKHLSNSKREYRRISAKWSEQDRERFISSVIHMSLNRFNPGFLGSGGPSVGFEYRAYRVALGILAKQEGKPVDEA